MKPKRVRTLDPRLLIGIGLVVSSVAGVYALVTAADATIEVYAAAHPLAPGDRISASDLAMASVQLDSAGGLYLAPGVLPPDGLIVNRHVLAGELVPISATASTDSLRLTALVVSVDGELAASVGPGSTVDVWASRQSAQGTFGVPSTLVSGATVVRLVASDTIVGAGKTTAIEILVPQARVARLLEAFANDDAVAVVPATFAQ